jgi:hypothetical protein
LENCRDVPKRSVAAVSSENPVSPSSENTGSIEEIDVSTSSDTVAKDTSNNRIKKIKNNHHPDH